jgi:hypothetical protein
MRGHYRITSMPETCLSDRSVLGLATGGLSTVEISVDEPHLRGDSVVSGDPFYAPVSQLATRA